MVVALNYHAKQSDIAQSIGVAQQEVSRWAAGTFEPATSFRYEALVREYMTRCLLAPEHQHTLEMYRANAHAGRRKPT
jgi:predicted transcriptional regulator